MRKTRSVIAVVTALALGVPTLLTGQAAGSDRGERDRDRGQVSPTVPITPSVATYEGERNGDTRIFRLTATEFQQQLATFPIRNATVWGWQVTGRPETRSTPGPTLVAYEGERIQFVVTNNLSQPTSLHPHGTHQPNENDGLAGINFDPIDPGETRTYTPYRPGHAGTFAYHTHTNTATQEPRGVVGLITILPQRVAGRDRPNVDIGMTLQTFNPDGSDADDSAVPGEGGKMLNPSDEGGLIAPMPDDRGMFPFFTINGRTGDASNTGVPGAPNGPIRVNQGDLVQIRLYNASSMSHSMHLHGMDMTVVDINGHPVSPQTVTTKAIAPGEFFTLQFRADNPGTWIFHCSFPDHQANAGQSGFQGAPVGMTRIIQVGDAAPVPAAYFGPPS